VQGSRAGRPAGFSPTGRLFEEDKVRRATTGPARRALPPLIRRRTSSATAFDGRCRARVDRAAPARSVLRAGEQGQSEPVVAQVDGRGPHEAAGEVEAGEKEGEEHGSHRWLASLYLCFASGALAESPPLSCFWRIAQLRLWFTRPAVCGESVSEGSTAFR
jgi:hypothetical protein